MTQIVNNKKTVLNLCRDCAEKRGMTANPLVQVPFPLAEILSSMMGEAPEKKKGRGGEARCPGCGFEFKWFAPGEEHTADDFFAILTGTKHRLTLGAGEGSIIAHE